MHEIHIAILVISSIVVISLIKFLFGGAGASEEVKAGTEIKKAELDLARTRLEQEHETEREKIKLELGNQKLDRELESQTKLEEKKLDLEKEKLLKEIEISKLELEMEAMREAFRQDALAKQQVRDRETQEMEFKVADKMIDKGYDPFELTYATAGISRMLRNDKSDNDMKYQREIARHRYAILKEQNLLRIAGSAEESALPQKKKDDDKGKGTFDPFGSDVLDSDRDENHGPIETVD